MGSEMCIRDRDILARGCRNVIVHRGAKGSSWVTSDFTVSSPSFKVKVVSPTGAGDVFNAGFIYAFLDGKAAEECLEFANACAALHISRTRARNAFPRLDEVQGLTF